MKKVLGISFLYGLFLFLTMAYSLYSFDGLNAVGGIVGSLVSILACALIVRAVYLSVVQQDRFGFIANVVFVLLLVVPLIVGGTIYYSEDEEFSYMLSGADSALFNVTLLFVAVFWVKGGLNRGVEASDSVPAEPKPESSRLQGRDLAVKLLRERANELKGRASVFLGLIMVLLITAGLTVVFAQYLTVLDRASASTLENAIQTTRDAFDKLKAAKNQLENFDASANSPTSPKGKAPTVSKKDLVARVERLQGEYDYYSAKEEKLLKGYQSSGKLNGALEDKEFLSTFTIRFGVTIIILFFVQVLVNLYRYNIRLSAYYDGKADALLLSDKEMSNFETIARTLSPDDLHFGNPPNTPLDKIIDMASKMGGTKPAGG